MADDEPLARRRVKQLLESHGGVTLVGEAADGAETVAVVRTLSPDLLFLDIQMPELNGFDALAHPVVRAVPVVVFLTAYAQFAARAFDVHATDYLLKPIRPARFRECLSRVRERLLLLDMTAQLPSAAPRPSLVVEQAHGRRVLHPEEVDWVEASDYYAVLHVGGKELLVREALTSLERRLPEALFVRVHRSALVNVTRVREVRGLGVRAEIELKDGTVVPVSRRRKSAVLARLTT